MHVLFSERSILTIHSSYISFYTEVYATNINLGILISSVPVKYLDTFNKKLATSLKLIVENGIDMQRIAMIIDRDERQVCGPHSNCKCL